MRVYDCSNKLIIPDRIKLEFANGDYITIKSDRNVIESGI